jgi:hypothetical protein
MRKTACLSLQYSNGVNYSRRLSTHIEQTHKAKPTTAVNTVTIAHFDEFIWRKKRLLECEFVLKFCNSVEVLTP